MEEKKGMDGPGGIGEPDGFVGCVRDVHEGLGADAQRTAAAERLDGGDAALEDGRRVGPEDEVARQLHKGGHPIHPLPAAASQRPRRPASSPSACGASALWRRTWLYWEIFTAPHRPLSPAQGRHCFVAWAPDPYFWSSTPSCAHEHG